MVEITFIARKVPPLGYRSLFAGHDRHRADHPGSAQRRRIGDGILENAALRLEIDPQPAATSRASSTSACGREFVAPGEEANKLWVYEDRPENWDAWNIGYTGRGWELNKADKVELVSSGPVKTVYRVDKSFLGLSKER